MQKNPFLTSTFCFIWIFLLVITPTPSQAAQVRKPHWAGKFYPAERSDLQEMIDAFTRQAQKTVFQPPVGKTLKALIMPHAGYIYSGLIAAHASLALRGGSFDKVILMGPDHRVGFRNGVISDFQAYETPLGRVPIHDNIRKLRIAAPLFQTDSRAEQAEHSLEVILPFLQSYLKNFALVPIVFGPTRIPETARVIETLLDPKTLLVASSDLSHYLPYARAEARDRETIDLILNLAGEKLSRRQNAACGIVPILILIELARQHRWEPVLIHYSNSGDTAGSSDAVVGYACIAFYGGKIMDPQSATLTPEQGQALVNLARYTLMEKLTPDKKRAHLLSDILKADAFKKHCGTFVTLKIKGVLRGCIGNLSAAESILEGVKRNALNAAFEDPRFPALTAKELEQVDIEVSILSEPQPLSFRDESELLAKLRPDIDGVIIRKGYQSATFLPQVWEQLPRKEDFLNHLCLKAGLRTDAWRKPGLEVKTYQVQYFDEQK